MSHFCLFVITKHKPTDRDLNEILSPWDGSEFNDHARKFIDVHDEITEEWENKTLSGYRSPEGKEYSPYDPVFEQVTIENAPKPGSFYAWFVNKFPIFDPSYKTTNYVVPTDYKKVEIPIKNLFKTVEDYARDWHDYTETRDGRIGYTDNPEAKWDWWQIGGRFSNMFSDKDPEDNPKNWERCDICSGTGQRNDAIGQQARRTNPDYNCNGCNGKGKSLKWPTQWVNEGNQVRIGDIDYVAMKAKAVSERLAKVERALKRCTLSQIEMERILHLLPKFEQEARGLGDQRPFGEDYDAWLRSKGPDGAVAVSVRDAFSNLPPKLRSEETLEDWVQSAVPFSTYALLIDGNWYERDDLSLWPGTDENSDGAFWDEAFEKLITSLPIDHWMTVVDCHQ